MLGRDTQGTVVLWLDRLLLLFVAASVVVLSLEDGGLLSARRQGVCFALVWTLTGLLHGWDLDPHPNSGRQT